MCLFDEDDLEMLNCKNTDNIKGNEQRFNANNSFVIESMKSEQEIDSLMSRMIESQMGEPNFFSRWANDSTMPERRERGVVYGTNPCLTGDSLVYTADGRGNVPISQLADEGNDVPVFRLNNRGKLSVRYMRHPRLTGKNKAIFELTLDDGSKIRTTENHKFLLNNGKYKPVSQLQSGDSLHILTAYKASLKDVFKNSKSKSQDYIWLKNNGENKSEHRLIASFHNNSEIPTGYVVHHKDFNANNNHPDNLEVMSKEDHDKLHDDRMRGDNNPMRRAKTEWSEEKWKSYRNVISKVTSGERNGRYSGVTHEELREHALILTKKLNRRFSTKEWETYAKNNNLPQHFSSWRKKHLGNLLGFAKWAAVKLGIEHVDLDPRTVKSYKKYTKDGYNCIIDNKKVYIVKECEQCSRKFMVTTGRREVGICSMMCYSKVNNHDFRLSQLRGYHKRRKEQIREKQLDVYTQLKFELNRVPLKKEWVECCKEKGISFEISRQSSPFRSYAQLKQKAELHNHRVVSVKFVGYEDVYNGTVDEFHNFFVGGWQGKTEIGKDKWVYINNLQCGEIVLKPHQFCNLSSVVARPKDNYSTLANKVYLATILGTIQTLEDNFPYLRDDWRENVHKERLLGVDLNGIMDCPALHNVDILFKLNGYAQSINLQLSQHFGINRSAAITTVKPSGNSSVMLDTSSGIHARWSPYYIRRAQIQRQSPLAAMFRDQAPDFIEDSLYNPTTTQVISFPVKSPDNAITKQDISVQSQLDTWKLLKENYTDHNPSVTITYKEDEENYLKQWVNSNQNIIGGMAFLPYSEHRYEQAPYEEITKETYLKLKKEFPNIQWGELQKYEFEDNTTRILECDSEKCEVKFM